MNADKRTEPGYEPFTNSALSTPTVSCFVVTCEKGLIGIFYLLYTALECKTQIVLHGKCLYKQTHDEFGLKIWECECGRFIRIEESQYHF